MPSDSVAGVVFEDIFLLFCASLFFFNNVGIHISPKTMVLIVYFAIEIEDAFITPTYPISWVLFSLWGWNLWGFNFLQTDSHDNPVWPFGQKLQSVPHFSFYWQEIQFIKQSRNASFRRYIVLNFSKKIIFLLIC